MPDSFPYLFSFSEAFSSPLLKGSAASPKTSLCDRQGLFYGNICFADRQGLF